MKNFYRLVWAEIDLSAIRHNIEYMRSLLAPRTQIMAVVKANGYGHGAYQVALTALDCGVQRLGVALVEEALELREKGIVVPIHLLSEPPWDSEEELLRYHLMPTIYTYEAAKRISDYFWLENRICPVHVKIDTGMHRVGMDPEEAEELILKIMGLPGLKIEGLMTHFAVADDPTNPYTMDQFKKFCRIIDALRRRKIIFRLNHCANSAATINFKETHLDMVRLGITLYGLNPSPKTVVRGLKPALSLKAKVSFIKELEEGERISYGLTYRTDRKSLIATIPIGYGDGYSRLLSNRALVLIKGKRAPVVGRVTMDQIMVDVTDIEEVEVGAEAVLIGHQGKESISADELAELVGTINYEIVCMIGQRVPRVYVSSELQA